MPAHKKPGTRNTTGYIIAIGASAGGLEPINDFFDNFPQNNNFSFIIIQHLSPDYKSLLVELITKHTHMKVTEAEHNVLIEPNCVYVIPNNKIMTVKDCRLQLQQKERSSQPNTAIDLFLKSLAEDRKDKAIAIILSGTGTDGTKGIEAIKKENGVVFVQDPLTSKFDGMPNSAIASGNADFIMAPELMPEEIYNYIQEKPLIKSFLESSIADDTILDNILTHVLHSTGQDFTAYKRPTLIRRITKRMAYNNIARLEEYASFLSKEPKEVKILCNDFLIGVTKFFRDTEPFEILGNKIIPAIIEGKEETEPIKVWVCACSTGEEAYSIAILFEENLKKLNRHNPVKIFATDVDKTAIDIATKGIFPSGIDKDVTEERLLHFFRKEGDKYQVSQKIRKMIVFAHHDIIKDPPFGRNDLISCRNMLIYMNPVLQRKVLGTIHYSLNIGGYLLLGSSESTGNISTYFTEIDRKSKIYKNISFRKSSYEPSETRISPPARITPVNYTSRHKDYEMLEHFKNILSQEYGFSLLYLDKSYEIKEAIGDYKQFVNLPENTLSLNLMKMVPTDLGVVIGASIRKAVKRGETITVKQAKVKYHSGVKSVNLLVQPVLSESSPYFATILLSKNHEEDNLKQLDSQPFVDNTIIHDINYIAALETELKETKENLQAAIEELESSNEELQSSNEELISSNEELQSSNEELQSLNEELHTVNAEHQIKIKELLELNEDMDNHFRNSNIGQIFVDEDLLIRKFNPAVLQQINVIETDIGRPIHHLSTNLKINDLAETLNEVKANSRGVEKEIELSDGKVFLMRIQNFIRYDKTKSGYVISFVDITEVKHLNNIIKAVFNATVNSIMAFKAIRNEQHVIMDFEYLALNQAACQFHNQHENEIIGHTLHQLNPRFNKHSLFNQLKKVVDTGTSVHFEHSFDQNGLIKWLQVVVVKLYDGVVVTLDDISQKKENEFTIEKRTSELESTNYDLMQFASVASHDLKEPLRKVQMYSDLLKNKYHSTFDENGKRYVESILRASSRMSRLIEDLLAFSRLSNRQASFELISLEEMLNEILDDLEVAIDEKDARFEIQNLPKVEVIPGQMRQVFQNLISNSLKFSRKEVPPHIIIKGEVINEHPTEKLRPKGPLAKITVEDNGIGFNNQFVEKIFTLFQRLHSKAEFEGTGIGLAIVKKIIEMHSGKIEATGIVNQGSRFTIYLPLQQHQIR